MQNENEKFEDLMIDYFSGDISEVDLQYLSNLLKSNNNFKMRFDEMVKFHAVSFATQIEAEKQDNYKKLMKKINDTPTYNISRSWFTHIRKIAAIIILVVSVSVASVYIIKDISSSNDALFCFETFSPLGSQTKVILPDSTIVWLNSGSSLKYNQSFGKKNREVTLLGEGYFEVKKNKGKPFLVHTDSLNVMVLGTVFNVNAYSEDAEVTVNLIEGVVNISLPKQESTGSFTMKPNEKLVFNKQSKKMVSSETDASRSALWTTGRLSFVDETIEQISKDLERKYDVKIKIANEQIKKELFSGSLNLNLSLNEILSYIDVDKKFTIHQVGDTIHIGIKRQ
ncbi:MAG: FecR family protein [Paludibacter sp.]|nr:FecR family protein [Paludibacter sp.]